MKNIKFISAKDLSKKDIPELRWSIENLLPEGLTILAGSPKTGKSIFALNLAIQISSGIEVLSSNKTNIGSVLYLSYEDGERRMKERINKICKGMKLDDAPSNFYIPDNCEFPELNDLTIDYMDNLINEAQIKLVVIDTLGSAIPEDRIQKNYNYLADYQMMKVYQKLALKNSMSIMMIHHTRKAKAESIFDEISGTRGITGSADVNMVMKKNVSNSFLHIQGRDIDEKIYEMVLDKENFIWKISGKTTGKNVSPEREMIINLFKEKPNEELKAQDFVERTGKSSDAVRQLLKSMKDDGQLFSGLEYGSYIFPQVH